MANNYKGTVCPDCGSFFTLEVEVDLHGSRSVQKFEDLLVHKVQMILLTRKEDKISIKEIKALFVETAKEFCRECWCYKEPHSHPFKPQHGRSPI